MEIDHAGREGIDINGPIYIGGVSYSGKTQLRFLLSHHPNIVITRRTYLWKKFNQAFGDLGNPKNFVNCLNEILKLESIQNLSPDPGRIRNEFLKGEQSYGRLFSIIHRQYANSLGKDRWGIQIGNVEKEATLLFKNDPDTKIIHMIRNPFERINESITTSNRRKLVLGLETNLWRESSRLAKENLMKYPSQYLVVRWEDLLKNVDQTLTNIYEFLGEKFDPEMIPNNVLEKMGFDIDPKSEMGHRGLLEKADRADYCLSKNDRAYISNTTGLEMDWFGYDRKKYNRQVLEKINYLFLDYPVYFLGEVIQSPLRLLRDVKTNFKKRNYIWQKNI